MGLTKKGSDYGIICDGDLVGQAVVAQLPTIILIEMKKHHHFYHHLFNRWWSSMLVLADKDIYPELIGGQAWFGKIADSLGYFMNNNNRTWYLRPKSRVDMMINWQLFIKKALNYREIDRSTVKQRDIVLEDGLVYDEFEDPFHWMGSHIGDQVERYQRTLEKEPKLSYNPLILPIPGR